MLTSWQQCITNDPSAYGQFLTIGGFDTGTWGIVYGFNDNSNYGSGAPNGKAGDLTTTLYRDLNDPLNPKVVRIASISVQQRMYLVLGWEPVAVQPTADMPIATGKLELYGTVYNFNNGNTAGFIPPVVGKWIGIATDSIPWNANTIGTKVPYKFV